MTRDDIIRLAREAGFSSYDSQDERLQLFAALVEPPRREWVSLTEQEIWDSVKHGVVGGIGMPSKAVAVARAIEAALKEKNT